MNKVFAGLALAATISIATVGTADAAYPPGPYSVTTDGTKCAVDPSINKPGTYQEQGSVTFTFSGPSTGEPIKITQEDGLVLYEGVLDAPTKDVSLKSQDSAWNSRASLVARIANQVVTTNPCGVLVIEQSGFGTGGSGSNTGSGSLPETGLGVGATGLGAVLVAAGSALTWVSRRRRATTA